MKVRSATCLTGSRDGGRNSRKLPATLADFDMKISRESRWWCAPNACWVANGKNERERGREREGGWRKNTLTALVVHAEWPTDRIELTTLNTPSSPDNRVSIRSHFPAQWFSCVEPAERQLFYPRENSHTRGGKAALAASRYFPPSTKLQTSRCHWEIPSSWSERTAENSLG